MADKFVNAPPVVEEPSLGEGPDADLLHHYCLFFSFLNKKNQLFCFLKSVTSAAGLKRPHKNDIIQHNADILEDKRSFSMEEE